MSDLKQVKVDNWGVYFLQRLKHFFNRTDYCDLTLQFQDNAQLKVHRLVLNACTEYFEILERTCEMYEDCMVMPDDLQADVVVPIVNFMYTGQLEFPIELVDKLLVTSQIMNMPVLTKLLDSQRNLIRLENKSKHQSRHSYGNFKQYNKIGSLEKQSSHIKKIQTPVKRSYAKSFGDTSTLMENKKKFINLGESKPVHKNLSTFTSPVQKREPKKILPPRPTRYEVPVEFENDLACESFSNISYESKPLMVHPDRQKHDRQESLKSELFTDPSTSKSYLRRSSLDVECKRIKTDNTIFDEDESETPSFSSAVLSQPNHMDTNELFDQILETNAPKITIETKDPKQASNLDHAKIINEVLKKYPHLVKGNKNIKLKILDTTNKVKKHRSIDTGKLKHRSDTLISFDSNVIDAEEAARLVALGVENVKGPWICLICGTPGKAQHFPTYYKFRRHLVDVHYEKPVTTMCEYCGLKSIKRNHLLHHLFTKHGVDPPATVHFPKCNYCNYVALTESLLIKHKQSHTEMRNFKCDVCGKIFHSSCELLIHIQRTGHKYSSDKKPNLQCVYCLRVFSRDRNLYNHLKSNHKQAAKHDGIIDDSDDEKDYGYKSYLNNIKKAEPSYSDDDLEDEESQYQMEQNFDNNIQIVTKKQSTPMAKQKILNPGYTIPKLSQKQVQSVSHDELITEESNSPVNEDVILIDNNEYIVKNNKIILKKRLNTQDEYILSDMPENNPQKSFLSPSQFEISNVHPSNIIDGNQHNKMYIKKMTEMNQPVQIVVSNEDEYKALMSSNHSIIFDSEDDNKTLTVLGSSQNANLHNANINLNNSQANDMMIIQEDYPINTAETMSSNNSNIVVVYSHPVTGDDKQYQVITTQGVETQFCQPGVIAQNYNNIITTPTVITPQAIETQTNLTWQNNNVQNLINTHMEMDHKYNVMPPVSMEKHINTIPAGLDIMSQTHIVEQSPMMSINQELPIVSMNNTESNVINNVPVVSVQNYLPQNTSDLNTISSELENPDAVNNQPMQVENDNVIIQSDTRVQNMEETYANDNIDTIAQSQNDVEIETENIPEQSIEDVEAEVETTENVNNVEAPDENLQNITSEWTEDEDESHSLKNDEAGANVADISTEGGKETEEAELEESIENIQEEVEKQLSEQNNEHANSCLQEQPANVSTEDENIDCAVEPQPDKVKINSLLNEWEDNDAQEENITNEKEIINAGNVPTSENEQPVIHENGQKDSVKTLVSDWDDEED